MRRGASSDTDPDAARVLADDEQDAIVADLRRSARASHAALSAAVRILAALLCLMMAALASCAASGVPDAAEVVIAALPPKLPRLLAAAAFSLSAIAHGVMALTPRRGEQRAAVAAAGACASAAWLALFSWYLFAGAAKLLWLPAAPLVLLLLQAAVDRQLRATLADIISVEGLKYDAKTA